MAKGDPPAFQFYADEFLADTLDFTPAEVGGYIRLLCFQWRRGSVPADQEKLVRITGIRGDFSAVLAKFEACGDGSLINARMEKERQQLEAYREKSSKNGAKGAAKRWGGHDLANGKTMARNDTPTPTPTPLIPSPSVDGGKLFEAGQEIKPQKPKKVREPCPIWDTVAELWFGGNVAKPHATRVGKVVRDLKDLQATPDEIRRRRKALAHKWPNVDVTPESLVKHWVQVGGKLAPTGPTLAELQAEAAKKLASKPTPTLTPEQKRAIMQQVKQTKGASNDIHSREDDRPGDEPTAGEADQQQGRHGDGDVRSGAGPVAGPDE